MVKKVVIKILRRITTYRLLRNQHKAINLKIHRLKKQGKLKEYPIKDKQPIICDYPFYKKSDKKWFNYFYSIYGKPDPGIIPLSVYYSVIEPCLNNRLLINAVKDKNYYDLFFKEIKTAEVIIRRINGQFYDRNYQFINLNDKVLNDQLKSYNKVILKPALFSGSGRGIKMFEKIQGKFKGGENLLTQDFLSGYGEELVIQKFIRQHEFFEKFNPESNNTIRVLTYRSVESDKIHILHTLLRIGAKGSFLDHDNKGGVSIAIDKDQNLAGHALNIYGDHIEEFNGIKFAEIGKVPFVSDFHKSAVYIAEQVFHGRLLAVDFTINTNGEPLLLEVNCWGNGISQYQMSSGSVFKEHTKEVLDFCMRSGFHEIIVFPVKFN
ncbi:MAG: hypothetical protein K9G76_00265 [Bacteroidales bacterium]|nr:hypothetical protein [Bacteroidales bacterium]MCF8402545.1 hypothetical protein [Bacteroidales bacterium]